MHTIDWILVRHGESLGNERGILQGHSDFALSAQGRRQAGLLGDWLAQQAVRPGAILTSPLKRASETAAIISQNLEGPSPVTCQALAEVTFGTLDGLPKSEVEQRYPGLLERLSRGSSAAGAWNPGAESVVQARRRARSFLAGLREAPPAQSIMVVTHGAFSQYLHRELLSIPRRARAFFALRCTSLSIIRSGRGWTRTFLLGATPHLTNSKDFLPQGLIPDPRMNRKVRVKGNTILRS